MGTEYCSICQCCGGGVMREADEGCDTVPVCTRCLDDLRAQLAAQQKTAEGLAQELEEANGECVDLMMKLRASEAARERAEAVAEAYRSAYTPDGHTAPHDCFSTGPNTGNLLADLVLCPGCEAERKYQEYAKWREGRE